MRHTHSHDTTELGTALDFVSFSIGCAGGQIFLKLGLVRSGVKLSLIAYLCKRYMLSAPHFSIPREFIVFDVEMIALETYVSLRRTKVTFQADSGLTSPAVLPV
jgi:hypothetical protein